MTPPKDIVLGALIAGAHALPATPQTLEAINPTGLYDPAPNGYTHVMLAPPQGRMVFIAGQGGETATGALAPHFDIQVAQAYENLLTALEAAGAAPTDVAKLTTYVVDYDEEKLAILTRHLVASFGDHLPAQTLVPVPRLALNGMLFEVDATAIILAPMP